MTKRIEMTDVKAQVEYINPPSLHHNPAFTNVVTVTGPVKTVYVGGQNAVDTSGAIVGKGDFKAQTEQTLRNVLAALEAGGAELENVVKWNVYIVQGQSLEEGFAAFQQVWGNRPNPPTISSMFVAGLAHPDFLLEIDAIAVAPE
jgi:enamine deaminase RidA (YjgF/YER057c/UK114 family)